MEKITDANLQMHLLELEITTRCNLSCKHCYNRNLMVIDMPILMIKEMLQFAKRYHVNTVVFSGGEAVMHPEFERICEYVKIYKNSIEKIVIQSNGEIGKIDKSLLKSFNSIHLSYDIDDLGIRVGGEENLNLAKKLNEEGIYTYLFSTVHKKNLNYIDEFVKRANQVHVDLGFNIYCDTGVDSGLALTTEEKLRVCKKLNILSKDGKILSFKNPMVSILENRSSEVFAGIRGGCSAGIASCDILPNGDVLPCPFLRLPVGNIYDNNLAEIWFESNILKALRDRRVYKGQCRKCPHLSYCGGCRKVAYEYTKDIQGEDPTCFKSLWSLK